MSWGSEQAIKNEEIREEREEISIVLETTGTSHTNNPVSLQTLMETFGKASLPSLTFC